MLPASASPRPGERTRARSSLYSSTSSPSFLMVNLHQKAREAGLSRSYDRMTPRWRSTISTRTRSCRPNFAPADMAAISLRLPPRR